MNNNEQILARMRGLPAQSGEPEGPSVNVTLEQWEELGKRLMAAANDGREPGHFLDELVRRGQ